MFRKICKKIFSCCFTDYQEIPQESEPFLFESSSVHSSSSESFPTSSESFPTSSTSYTPYTSYTPPTLSVSYTPPTPPIVASPFPSSFPPRNECNQKLLDLEMYEISDEE